MLFASVRDRYRLFLADRRGNVAMIFGLSFLALIGMAGFGVDYYNALAAKSKLDMAADAAVLAAITTAQAYIEANSGGNVNPTAAALAQGQAQALKVFKVNAGKTMSISATPAITMTRSGQTINASVTYTAKSPNSFGPLFGIPQITTGGNSSSSLTMGKYLDFYLLLDVSGSMGLPSTAAGQAQLATMSTDNNNQNPLGNNANFCAFACHFSQSMCTSVQNPSSHPCEGYTLARSNNIQLRADAVGNAVQQLLTTATQTETIPNQYRIGLYPFISHTGTLYGISSNLAGAQTAAGNLGTLLDQGQSTTAYGSGGTHFENAIPELNSLITTVGDGSGALLPQPFVFLVTDGAENYQYYTTPSNSWTGSQPASLDPSLCANLKSRGITVAVLYIPYPPITPPSHFAGDEDYKVNAIIPSIPSNMQQCASTGFFYTANTPSDITNAMQAMFAQSLAAARLTH